MSVIRSFNSIQQASGDVYFGPPPTDVQNMHSFLLELTCDRIDEVMGDLFTQMASQFETAELMKVNIRLADVVSVGLPMGSSGAVTDLSKIISVLTIPSTKIIKPPTGLNAINGSMIASMNGYKSLRTPAGNIYSFKIPKSQRNQVFCQQLAGTWHDEVTRKAHITEFIDKITQSKWQFPHMIFCGVPTLFSSYTPSKVASLNVRIIISFRFRLRGLVTQATIGKRANVLTHTIEPTTYEKIECALARQPYIPPDYDSQDSDEEYDDEDILEFENEPETIEQDDIDSDTSMDDVDDLPSTPKKLKTCQSFDSRPAAE